MNFLEKVSQIYAKMEKKRKIVQYRERLDRTLASDDLTNVEILKKLVRSQLLPSSELEDEGYKEKLIERKTAEISNFLDMLRSASDDRGRSNTPHNDWKLKQDSDEFRVMYRQGPEGTPFHTMLVEGFVDGPVDVCLCISWQTSLYKKWWPQSTIPTFKILSSECLQKVQIGEQISLVRMKVSWPLSMREAVVHYYLFEYFQEDLVVVLTNSVPDSKSVAEILSSFNDEAIPEANDVVRIDLVGGFALQKCTPERSYFRTIANMDVKVDFVPPSLINFISRQLIGNGFRLYQKVVASVMSQDKEEFSKALGDPLYARIREALYSTSSGELPQVARIHPAEDLVESKKGEVKVANNVVPSATNATVLENSETFGEIVELGKEEIVESVENNVKANDIPNDKVGGVAQNGKRGVYIRSEVEQALETLDKAISLSQYKSSRKRVGGLKLEELPGLDALKIPGTSDGQTKVVREGDNGVAYAWNMAEQKWDKIGEVVDGPEGSSRPLFDGAQYDYVFDVDIGDGMPIRKLPYNRSDNAYDVADKWLLKEGLPLSFREQVVQFILQNSGQKDVTFDASFRDPYTGSNAYVPGQHSRTSDISAKPTFKHIPKKGMLVFDTAQFDGILKKVVEFNNALLSDQEKQKLSLAELDVSRLDAIVKTLKDTSHYHSSKFADSEIALLMKMLSSWPITMIFPVIDIVRMLVLHPEGAVALHKHLESEKDILMEVVKKVTINPTIPANLLTSVRAVTNLFKNSCYYNWLQKHRSEILDAFSSCSASTNKNLQLSYSTLILNYAVLLIESKDQEGQSQVLSAALEIVEDENVGPDSKFRALVAVGSLMLEGLVKKIALDFDVLSIAKAAKGSKDSKIAEVGSDIELVSNQS